MKVGVLCSKPFVIWHKSLQIKEKWPKKTDAYKTLVILVLGLKSFGLELVHKCIL